jgi:hypothetical protein
MAKIKHIAIKVEDQEKAAALRALWSASSRRRCSGCCAVR